jgi:plastocyanin
MMREKLLWLSSLGLGLVLAACGGGEQATTETAEPEAGAPAGDVEPVDPATAGAITGTISFDGDAPRMPRIRMDAVPACTEVNKDPVYSEEVVVNDNGTLRNVFIYVKDGLGERRFPVPSEAMEIEQNGCVYSPHVLGLMAGQTLRVKNSDPTNHNVHPLPTSNREWNQSQPPGSSDLEEQFARPEIMIPVKCNVHPWMKAYIGVQRHPFFATSGADGTFSIEGLPPGTYTIEAWHEKYEAQEMQVTVGESETATADFSFSEG